MKSVLVFVSILFVLLAPTAGKAQSIANEADWSFQFDVPDSGRSNPYEISPSELDEYLYNGRIHTLHWPVDVSQIRPPYHSVKRFIEEPSNSPLRKILQKLFQSLSSLESMSDFLKLSGAIDYPESEGEGVYFVPFKDGTRPDYPMGTTLIDHPDGTGFTLSCTTCHASNLFGTRVIGLTNRFPRANEFFVKGKMAFGVSSPTAFKLSTNATDGEVELFKQTKDAVSYLDAREPMVRGLDTSLAHVALSLARRAKDPWASKTQWNKRFPRKEKLKHFAADSKPAVWWNLKYKNRWLSDGSVISGNPILTNILWNEIGRGMDLKLLEDWMENNNKKIKELTTAVFSTEAPRFTDFFPAENFDVEMAMKGEKHFENRCAKCHGTYDKAWNLPGSENFNAEELLATISVNYPQPTRVKNVGTDPQRWEGMTSLEQLNDLAISKVNGIVIQAQEGYVPPPLVGIWARWPYFHNNSVPSLCALLTRSEDRPETYWAIEANDPQTDFDYDCNGYPLDVDPVARNLENTFLYDTSKQGLGNDGHDEGIFLENGKEVFSMQEKLELIKFLQTL